VTAFSPAGKIGIGWHWRQTDGPGFQIHLAEKYGEARVSADWIEDEGKREHLPLITTCFFPSFRAEATMDTFPH